jgi:hypothetical protein
MVAGKTRSPAIEWADASEGIIRSALVTTDINAVGSSGLPPRRVMVCMFHPFFGRRNAAARLITDARHTAMQRMHRVDET